MATQPAPLFDDREHGRRWVADYRRRAGPGDVLAGDDPAWVEMFAELAAVADGGLDHARERVRRHALDIGTGFRVQGEADERALPVSPVPLLIPAAEWEAVEAGITQRAELLEAVLADLYGPQTLVRDGRIPAALMTGSALFLRQLVGLTPTGGRHLHCVAFDLARGPGGEWRVLADQLRSPAGAGYALENRLAVGRTLGGLAERLHIRRHAPFFAALRAGLAALCRRADPRIALLTPGRFSPSYAEQAHLARYLGLLLVEGADLAALDGRLYVRTIAGLKRIDALWGRIDPRLLDPLAFDTQSQIGVPGLIDAWAAGEVAMSNAPGAGVLEARAWSAFLPALAEPLLGEALRLPTIATWWCGGDAARAEAIANLDQLVVAPAFDHAPAALPDGRPVLGGALDPAARQILEQDLAKRPQDYVAQEVVRLSTMPVITDTGELAARPFTLRVFATRGPDGGWTVMPGGFVRIGDGADARALSLGEGSWSADACVHGPEPQAPVSLLQPADSVTIRRNPGTLPSRVADNFFWLGRYLERGEALLTAVRLLLGHSIDAGGGAALATATVERLVGLIAGAAMAPPPRSRSRAELTAFARAALEDPAIQSVARINCQARAIGAVSRDRLSADMARLLDAPFPTTRGMLDRAGSLQRRYAALSGLCAEHMVRTDAWRFLDLGRRIERGMAGVRAARLFGLDGATADDLSTLLDLADSQISYRQRYAAGIARVPVLDLVVLDGGNPRSLAFQVRCLAERLRELPVLNDDGMAEPQQALATELAALTAIARAGEVEPAWLLGVETRLAAVSDAIADRYFLHGAQALRAGGLTLA
jgi:uncharacterized circularly permuted ATP-grasp superfamily protein/uncharacterized alpha-E superfamily protein